MTGIEVTESPSSLTTSVIEALRDPARIGDAWAVADTMAEPDSEPDTTDLSARFILGLLPGARRSTDPDEGDLIVRLVAADVPASSAFQIAAAARVHAERRNPRAALGLIRYADEAFGDVDLRTDDGVQVATVWFVAGLLFQLAGDQESAVDFFQRIAVSDAPAFLRYHGLSGLALVAAESGRVGDALALADDAWAIKAHHGWDDSAHSIPALSATVLGHSAMLDPAAGQWAMDRLDAVLALSPPPWVLGALRVKAQQLCVQGQPQQAATIVREATNGFDIESASPQLRAGIGFALAQTQLLGGEPGRAVATCVRLLDDPALTDVLRPALREVLSSGLIVLGKPDEVRKLLRDWAGDPDDPGVQGRELLAAASASLAGDSAAAKQAFDAWLDSIPSAGMLTAALLPRRVWEELLDGVDRSRIPAPVVRLAHGGTTPLDRIHGDFSRLTATQRKLLSVLRTPGTLEDAAAAAHLSRNTIKTHLAGLMNKFDVGTRAGVVDAAEAAGWYELPSYWQS